MGFSMMDPPAPAIHAWPPAVRTADRSRFVVGLDRVPHVAPLFVSASVPPAPTARHVVLLGHETPNSADVVPLLAGLQCTPPSCDTITVPEAPVAKHTPTVPEVDGHAIESRATETPVVAGCHEPAA